ncbi:synaptobrevin YKT6 [Monocercomonoides exilis]|uniref:synaptobrevin YKT6 n=1 Tax=Monocercomonoides exilis TaxID=2049356 RepID=UPI00355ABDBF|nr:synaptobrevin YKT6 [Monocercomonoides exilis]|eukprot:MONOS_9846.1-p1 / transcript=MONOS_9846.1 / gene=MONOS_9846 / organism=Monocercomonoides_exilis_PA203 / gene_product= synaptobrevin homolog YKT6 / transcript_product= synaptobrevin homolog YKT6 / location=Mono_scaffold00422:22973-23695(+) / protein_length=188 / sequence_SO=supercontig / SO=protein_coding / is_pseudo=false
MKVIGLALCTRPASERIVDESKVIITKDEYDLSSIPFFERKNCKSLIQMAIRVLCGKVAPGGMRSLNYPDIQHVFHVVVKSDGRAACTVTDVSYPTQSGISSSLGLLQKAATIDLTSEIKRLQNPAEADKILRLQREIDAVKAVMVENIDKVLERGEKIDDLVERSAALNDSSKQFYKRAKKLNGCC